MNVFIFIDIYMCKIIYKSTHMVHSFIIHRDFQCIFTNFCYRFQPFFGSQVFSQGFSEVSVEQFSQTLFIGFFTGFFRGVC